MIKRGNVEEKRKRIINFIRNNPTTTYREVKKVTGLHPNRYFNGLSEAFKIARVKNPRTFYRKSKEERKKIVIDYIRKNQQCNQVEIIKNTGIKIQGTFKSIEDAFNSAGIKYPRRGYPRANNNRRKLEKKEEIIKIIKKNPYLTLAELEEKYNLRNFYSLFKSQKEMYAQAKIKNITRAEKRSYKKRKKVTEHIKKNPFATQREINRECNTHVQELYENGIFDAYKEAEVKFPFERLRQYGIGLEKIRKRARSFEDEIAVKLSGFGTVNRLVKTKRGFADIILERKGEKVVIEVKDYQNKDISISQVRQLNKYLEDTKIKIGILICHKKPRKDRFIMGENKILILEKKEIKNIPSVLEDL